MVSQKVKDYIIKLNTKDKEELQGILGESIFKEEVQLVKDSFEITGNKEDIITNKEFDYIIKFLDLDLTPYFLRNLLKSLGAKNWRNSENRGLSGVRIGVKTDDDAI